ncbi:MAG: PadR family transcriptional regulator [bacterium]|uniref:PadR family transcriptional regulator n=1 Tax=Candidatus Aphodosoma intestinipullorum TaxID=2840674 RepID=A0A940DJK5_9BACT|nr:PadR family transcriptional regulator [Candidatus Aphodosoma intestinipullorum]
MAGTSENIQAQMRKGILEYCILLILSRQASYASEIIAELKQAELIVVEGTLYPLLTRLKNSGLLTYSWAESTQGPPRKYYALTDEGRDFLQVLERSWDEINSVVTSVRNGAVRRTGQPNIITDIKNR